jgi:hypothetical protein
MVESMLVEKYIAMAKENIEYATKNKSTKAILTLTEAESLNQTIANKITEFLEHNGYTVKLVIFKNGCILNISW